jgi:hypothetical protein
LRQQQGQGLHLYAYLFAGEEMSKERKEIQSMAYAYIDGLFDGKKKRPWVGLTDAEYEQIHLQMNPMYFYKDFARAVEAKLREKNQ